MLIKDINNALDRYDAACKVEDAKLRKARDEFAAERITRKTLEDVEAEHRKVVANLVSECRQGIMNALEKYQGSLHGRYVRTPESLSGSDAMLLESSLALDKGDLEAMAERNRDNLPLVRCILDYAKAHGIEVDVTFYSEAQRREEAADFTGAVVSAVKDRNGLRYAYVRSGRLVPESLVGE